MYAVTDTAREAWSALFRAVATRSGVPLEIVEHPFPRPVAALWQRTDLACAFMCGWPWVRGGARHVPVAAPVPVGAGGPFYWSDLVVRAGSPARGLDDMRGSRAGFTLLDSQSGFSALRHHLRAVGSPGFAEVVGPLTTPRRSIEAVAAGRADLAPIDSYAHALLRLHDPALAAQVRVLARTAPTPVPLLVASPGADPAATVALQAALRALDDPALLAPLALDGFTAPRPLAEYQAMEARAQEAERAGVHNLSAFLQRVPA